MFRKQEKCVHCNKRATYNVDCTTEEGIREIRKVCDDCGTLYIEWYGESCMRMPQYTVHDLEDINEILKLDGRQYYE